MAKKKTELPKEEISETRYYWCVNCGHHGDYGFVRKRGLNCEMCAYDAIATYSLEEINDPTLDNVSLDRFKKKKATETESKLISDLRKENDKFEADMKKIEQKKSIQERLDEIRNMVKK